MPKEPARVWQGHQSTIEIIRWDPRGHLLASSASDDSQIFVWSPKSNQPAMVLNDHSAAIRDFKWSNVDASQGGPSNSGAGFIVSLSMDQTVKVYDISTKKGTCLMTLPHNSPIFSLALSPDNQLLAVGG